MSRIVFVFTGLTVIVLAVGAAGIVKEASSSSLLPIPPPSPSPLRHYYIMAEEYEWNYVPSGMFNNKK